MFDATFDPLPEGWEMSTLGEVCRRTGGSIQTGPFGSQLHASDYVENGVPVVMPVNIGDNRIVAQGIARVSDGDASRLARHRLRAGDIVYSRRGDVERRALVRPAEEGWLCGTGCLRVRFGDDAVDSRYASYYLDHPAVRSWIVRHAVGATMANLNTSILSETPFLVPPPDEQLAIIDTLGGLEDKIESSYRVESLATDLAKSLFQQHATGSKVRLSDVATPVRQQIDPRLLGDELVDYFSIPAFDAGKEADLTAASAIMSNKFELPGDSVLVSRLNPRFPRVWLAALRDGRRALASTEFLPLQPLPGSSLSDVWLTCSTPSFQEQMLSKVTGTSGSHQRVRPEDALALDVEDTRDLPNDDRELMSDLLADSLVARRQISAARALRDSLLPGLVSGRLRLLERTTRVGQEAV